MLTAQLGHAPTALVDGLALVFLVSRLVYIGLYVGDLATARSAVWTLGFVASIALFFTPIWG